VRHPEDGKLMTLVDAGVFLAGAEATVSWLGGFYIDVHPTSNADYARFLAARPPCTSAVVAVRCTDTSGGRGELPGRYRVRHLGWKGFADGCAVGEGGLRPVRSGVSLG
jgi:hypothetical protein